MHVSVIFAARLQADVHLTGTVEFATYGDHRVAFVGTRVPGIIQDDIIFNDLRDARPRGTERNHFMFE